MKYQIVRSKHPTQPYFWRIVAENGQTVAVSENFVAKASAVSMIDAVIRGTPSATVEDLTLSQAPQTGPTQQVISTDTQRSA